MFGLMGEMYTVGMRNDGWIYFLAMEIRLSPPRRVSCATEVGPLDVDIQSHQEV